MWVQIEKTILKASERTGKLPEDTLRHDYVMRLDGFLISGKPETGNEVTVRTATGREVTGTIVAVNPEFGHGFGKPVEELMHIGPVHRKILAEGRNG